ncbi:hypothetical protein JRQ81_000061 [Phrynocephalus forsythii]|uniref:Uncharacterized protein n=1 Tax=Phrynocephalus forsythii TaxID=171643 RepID=A0A9Q0Y6X4_9SAUR|nr:hypothetical protein JRQ81_000061 [Phrynocephalus forsythii]
MGGENVLLEENEGPLREQKEGGDSLEGLQPPAMEQEAKPLDLKAPSIDDTRRESLRNTVMNMRQCRAKEEEEG